jgi:site-specific DNA-methyltransferase (adenine-specific)
MPITLHNGDCLEAMMEMEDNAFDLAIVDPPYGLGFGKFNRTNKDSDGNRYKADKYHHSEWDSSIPTDAYFVELKRVSKHQIVWGGNYFPHLWSAGCKEFVFWYKQNPVNNFSDGELAWTSFEGVAKCFPYRYYGNIQGLTSADEKIHPTQKPAALYMWLLQKYAKEGDRILDTHLGSGSIAIACHNLGYDLVGYELDKEYFQAAKARLEEHQKQLRMF